MKDNQVVLSPGLQINAEEFAKLWNSSSKCEEIAQAKIVNESTAVSFPIDPDMLEQGRILLSGVAVGVGGVALAVMKDLIKENVKRYLKDKFPKKQLDPQVESIRQPDGTYLFVIKNQGE